MLVGIPILLVGKALTQLSEPRSGSQPALKAPVVCVCELQVKWIIRPIADRLTKQGRQLLLPPEGFGVKGAEGPLNDGELARAVEWRK